jgi:hypothetical protein
VAGTNRCLGFGFFPAVLPSLNKLAGTGRSYLLPRAEKWVGDKLTGAIRATAQTTLLKRQGFISGGTEMYRNLNRWQRSLREHFRYLTGRSLQSHT